MTIIIDDAGVGDLLFGVVIGAFRDETEEFRYDVLDVKYFKIKRFHRKEYLKQASKIIFRLLEKIKIKPAEPIHICRGYIFDEAAKDLEDLYGINRVCRVKVIGKPQFLTEKAYVDEIKNLGYEPIEDRSEKRAKNFFHMMKWLEENPEKLRHAKNGWPGLSKYRLFRLNNQIKLKGK